jgi:hypothetical protein
MKGKNRLENTDLGNNIKMGPLDIWEEVNWICLTGRRRRRRANERYYELSGSVKHKFVIKWEVINTPTRTFFRVVRYMSV